MLSLLDAGLAILRERADAARANAELEAEAAREWGEWAEAEDRRREREAGARRGAERLRAEAPWWDEAWAGFTHRVANPTRWAPAPKPLPTVEPAPIERAPLRFTGEGFGRAWGQRWGLQRVGGE